jgi:hypothetical protein
MKKKTKTPIYTADQVFAIAKLLGLVFELYPSVNKEQKMMRSIAYDLEEKFSSKKKSIIKKSDLFSDTTHKMSLKFHEEVALCKIVTDMLEMVTELKPKNDLRIVRNYLDEKLA